MFLGLKTLHSVRSRNSRNLRCSCSSSLVYDDTRNSFVCWYCWWVPQWTCLQTQGLLKRDFLKQQLYAIFLRAHVNRVRFQLFLPVDLWPLLLRYRERLKLLETGSNFDRPSNFSSKSRCLATKKCLELGLHLRLSIATMLPFENSSWLGCYTVTSYRSTPLP